MTTPTFGLFDHIEGIPGTPTHQLFRDRLDLITTADQAGFASYHIAEHHASDLCLAPNQDLFIAAASQVTTNIRLGPMVKLLPLHHPVGMLEDLATIDQLTGGRVEYGVGRGAVPAEHAWHGSDHRDARERFTDSLGIISRALRTGTVSSEGSRYYDFPPMPLGTLPLQESIPFWYPGNPVTAGQHGMNLMWPGPIDKKAYDIYVESWEKHKDDPIRLDGPSSRPTVACSMIVAISSDEQEALAVARRGMDGLMRRTFGAHRFDAMVVPVEERDQALTTLRAIHANLEGAIGAGAGTPEQIADRFASLLEPGLIDRIVLQVPAGDMTSDEARRTVDLFAGEVMRQLLS